MNETDLIQAMQADFKEQHLGSFWRKIHGDKYMAGMPDVLAALPDVAALCEFKWEEGDKWLMMPFAELVKHRLTGLQAAELTMLSVIGETCPLRARVLIGFPVESEEFKYEMAVGFDMSVLNYCKTFSAADLAGVAVHARETAGELGDMSWPDKWKFTDRNLYPYGSPLALGLEMQLRRTPSSEKWRVGPLVLGLRRYKVYKTRDTFNPDEWDAMYGDER